MKHYKFYKPRSSTFSSNSLREVLLATQEMLNILVVTVFSIALAENTLSKLLNFFLIISTIYIKLGLSNRTIVSSTSSMGGYLEARLTDPNNNRQLTPWKSVCGGSQWTNKEALVAFNQLRYHNTTAIGK